MQALSLLAQSSRGTETAVATDTDAVEVTQWPETQIDRMLAALETSRGKIPNSKMM